MKINKDNINKLNNKLEGQFFDSTIIRSAYATDASMFKVFPQFVAYPKTEEDIFHLLEFSTSNNLPVAPRGAGTGLAGESLTSGMIIDLSKHFNQIKNINRNDNSIIVSPGVVHGQLNNFLKKDKLIFGPDPATSNRCTIGGMIANNSTGAHSLKYGMTSNWVKNLKIMLADGSILNTSNIINTQNKKYIEPIKKIINQNQDLITRTWPQTPRNRHGYLLYNIIKDNKFLFEQLFLSSEGTLGIILEAELGLASIPQQTTLISIHFENNYDALYASHLLLEFNPNAVEIIDSECLNIARANTTYKQMFPEEIKSILLVEFEYEYEDKLENIIGQALRKLKDNSLLCNHKRYIDNKSQKLAWNLRKQVAGMINKFPGTHQPVPMIEDVCVHPKHLKDYIMGVEEILNKWNIKYLVFGHAGDGTVHLRPFLNLKSSKSHEIIPEICNLVYDLTIKFNGTISGEHGDGYLRAPFIKKQYGEEMYNLFANIKSILDPQYVLNPDKKTGAPQAENWKHFLKLTKELVPNNYTPDLSWNFNDLANELNKCNGCGTCRSVTSDTEMCPIFKFTNLEINSPRAKVNTIRNYFQGDLRNDDPQMLKEIYNLCLGCGRCESECPSNVEIRKIVYEMRSLLKQNYGLSLQDKLMQNIPRAILLGGNFPKLANFISKLPPIRLIQSKIVGISSNRSLPLLNKKIHSTKGNQQFIYFSDIYPGAINTKITNDLINIFKLNNLELTIPKAYNSGIVEYTYANTNALRKLVNKNIRNLIPLINNGAIIICPGPSATLMLTKEYQNITNSEEAELLAKKTYFYANYLNELESLKPFTQKLFYNIAYHTSCHQKQLIAPDSPMELLKQINGITLKTLDTGCCGLSGTFGLKTNNQKLSDFTSNALKIAINKDNINLCVSDCGSCLMQLSHLAPNKKHMHSIEIMAKAYGL